MLNKLNIEAYAFCVESPLTLINGKVRNIDYNGFGGTGAMLPEPASLVAIGMGLASLLGLRRKK